MRLLILLISFPLFALVSQAQQGQTSNSDRIAQEILEAYEGDLDVIERVAENAHYALLAWAAYGDEIALELAKSDGWYPLKNYGVKSSLITGGASATLFVSDSASHVLAFRGTNSPLDWVTNVPGSIALFEASDVYSQIRDASRIAREASDEFGDELVIVGHSLGARMAQIAALENERHSVVFDRAPFGLAELRKWPDLFHAEPSSILRFRGWADPLTAVNPFAHDDVAVLNFARSPNRKDYKYGHNINLLALAMREVRTAWEEGWIETSHSIVKEEQQRSSEPYVSNSWSVDPKVRSIIGEIIAGPNVTVNGCRVARGPLSKEQVTRLLTSTSFTYSSWEREGEVVQRFDGFEPIISSLGACFGTHRACGPIYLCDRGSNQIEFMKEQPGFIPREYQKPSILPTVRRLQGWVPRAIISNIDYTNAENTHQSQ